MSGYQVKPKRNLSENNNLIFGSLTWEERKVRSMKLLIVDDEKITTEVLEKQIDRKRLLIDEVYTAYDVKMAEEILEKEPVDIVLCDIEMPRENGLQLLEWVRHRKLDSEFLFLTSHEKFEYALGAVKNGAANYLLKPVDIPAINKALLDVVEKITKEKQLHKIEEYWNYGKRKAVREFWRELLLGKLYSEEEVEEEISRLGLPYQKKGRLVLFHMRKESIFRDVNLESLDEFILDNILAESFTGNMEMERIVHWQDNGEYYIAVIAPPENEQAREKAGDAFRALENFYNKSIYAIYIAQDEQLYKIHRLCEKILEYDRTHLCDEGEIIFFETVKEQKARPEKVLDQKIIFRFLEKGERVRMLEYLQKIVLSLGGTGQDMVNIQCFQMELVQTISAFLYQKNQTMDFLFADTVYSDYQRKAVNSRLDSIRWITYFVNRVFDNMQEQMKSDQMLDVLVDYIHTHYEKNISRNSLAELVHFSPEYVGKVFKKKMGISIHEYVNQYRIERAKILMETTEHRITEIALQVGFENMPYFSSTFKKYEGVSPAEYRKKHR